MTKPKHGLTIAKVRAAITACGNRATAHDLSELLNEKPSVIYGWIKHQIGIETRIAIADWKPGRYRSGKNFRSPVYAVIPAGESYRTESAPVRVLKPVIEDGYEKPSYEPTEEEVYRIAAELREARPRPPVGYSEVRPVETREFGVASARLGQRIFRGR